MNRALEYALPAAEAGYPGSQLIVGNYHLAGGPDGLVVDPREAARWHRAAAARGNSGAQYNLAFSFATGRGVSENPVEACFWAAASVGCSPIRSRPAEALQAQELEKLTVAERDEVDARLSDFLSRWPQPWSEHLVYWKRLARLAGLDVDAS